MAGRVPRAAGGQPGGSVGLVGLIDEHSVAVAADLAERFGVGVDRIGDPRHCTWGRAGLLLQAVAADWSTRTAAAANGWSRPWSDSLELAAALFDLTHRAHAKNPDRVKPYPRPWDKPDHTQHGRPSIPQADVRDVLRAMATGADHPMIERPGAA